MRLADDKLEWIFDYIPTDYKSKKYYSKDYQKSISGPYFLDIFYRHRPFKKRIIRYVLYDHAIRNLLMFPGEDCEKHLIDLMEEIREGLI